VGIPLKKVLVVAYHYPPLGGGGVFRTLKLTKYLPEFGYQPYVLTVKNPMYGTRDPTLLKEIPPEVKIFRTFSFEHRILRAPRLLKIDLKWFYIPDENIGWLPFAVSAGAKIVKKENIDLIYATSPPWTSLLIGFLLKKKTKRPLVIDFRDPWTDNPFTTYPTKIHESVETKMEEKILKLADHIITTTEPMALNLIDKHPFTKGKCTTITNGFDPEDFKNLRRYGHGERFTITYVGRLYGLRSSRYFLTAIKELIEEKEALRRSVQALLVGHSGKETKELVKEFKLHDTVKLVGYLAHKRTLEFMINSDVLLLLIATEEAIDEKIGPPMVPGKLYEYLAAKRPILALIPEGAAADIIRSTKSGIVVPPKDINSTKQAILKFFQEWKRGSLGTIQSDITKYDRRALTEKLAKIFSIFV
jgi:glycosyltransferase involved in cell wall biosynthesis